MKLHTLIIILLICSIVIGWSANVIITSMQEEKSRKERLAFDAEMFKAVEKITNKTDPHSYEFYANDELTEFTFSRYDTNEVLINIDAQGMYRFNKKVYPRIKSIRTGDKDWITIEFEKADTKKTEDDFELYVCPNWVWY